MSIIGAGTRSPPAASRPGRTRFVGAGPSRDRVASRRGPPGW